MSPLFQRCTSGPTPTAGDAVPRPATSPARNGAPAARLAVWRSSCPDPHPGRGHTHVTSAGGGTPLMTGTDPTPDAPSRRGRAAHSSAPGGLVKSVVELDRVVIRLAGDSGDGMQLTGNRFTSETATFGNDLSTLPNFPAEIRAPTGTLPGVSSFQLHFADHDIMTPGDAPDVLVVMNPAALKANLADLPGGGLLIVDSDEFTPRNLAKVGYATNPLEDGSLEGWQTGQRAADLDDHRRAQGLRPRQEGGRAQQEHVHPRPAVAGCTTGPPRARSASSSAQFRRKPEIAAANIAAFRAGYNYGETTEAFAVSYEIKPAPMAPGPLPQHLRQPGAGARPRRRRPALGPADVPRRLPDHAGVGHPPRAVQAQGLRRPHVPGRGRDRRHRRGDRRLLRRRAGRHDDVRARASR